ncbi:MAG: SDR family oxidoreductase [Alphaproteobacteria bacterium]|nr:SDR family oxidoreductase [Alphaproteobacteria bacterium]
MPTILITGTSRGLGLEFTRQYLKDDWHVIACCRSLATSSNLKSLKGNIEICELDVTDEKQIENLAKKLSTQKLDILLNNAGVGTFEDTLGKTSTTSWVSTFVTNVIGPIHMVEYFRGSLLKGDKKLVVNITSRMGSIEDNQSGQYYAYRTSKAALNMATKNLAVDLKSDNIKAVAIHPGWVKTDMGGQNAPLTVNESVTAIRRTIDTIKPQDTGSFLNYDGSKLPW